jgi:two-component system cell cycle sensor histidine kinase/response regulator CckA
MVPPAPPALVPAPAVDPAQEASFSPLLLIDDDAAVRHVAQGMLERLGYQVLAAGDGSEALARHAAESRRIRLVLVDFSMPGMDGVEVLRELRRRDPEVRVVLMSGDAGLGFEERFQPGELAGFLPKPFSLSSMREALRAAVA